MTVRYARRARADIEAIFDYIDRHNKAGARNVVAAIKKTADLLGAYPGAGRATDIANVRVIPLVTYPYLLYYTIKDDTVVIIHVRHGLRELPDVEDLS